MHFQVVHCHPLADSYSHALFETIARTLQQRGHRVTATDLYREQFDPVMQPGERQSYYQAAYAGAAIADYIALLRQVDGLVFCFPQWWFGMPAMLKGYFDRVWAPGIAFTRDAARAR